MKLLPPKPFICVQIYVGSSNNNTNVDFKLYLLHTIKSKFSFLNFFSMYSKIKYSTYIKLNLVWFAILNYWWYIHTINIVALYSFWSYCHSSTSSFWAMKTIRNDEPLHPQNIYKLYVKCFRYCMMVYLSLIHI